MSSDTPSWWSNPLGSEPELTVTLPADAAAGKAQAGAAAGPDAEALGDATNRARASPTPKRSPARGSRLSTASKPATEVSFGVWQGSAATQPTQADQGAAKAPGASPAKASPRSISKGGAQTSKLADVSLQGWAQQAELLLDPD